MEMTKKRKPFAFEGSGSAIDNYFSEKPDRGNWGIFDAKDTQDRQILSLVRTLQWTIPNDRHGEVADMAGSFSRWLQGGRAPVGKPLNGMSPEEKSTTISALTAMTKKMYA